MWFRKRNQSSVPSLPPPFERGPAKFFHGRTNSLENFRKFTELLAQTNTGSPFLIQGAPGAGKTALLAECLKQARSKGWRASKISVLDLWNPDRLRVLLGLKKKKLENTALTGELPRFLKREVRRRVLTESTKTVIQECKGAVLLTLDEAQTLELEHSPEQKHIMTDVLNAIHNSEMGTPVILLAAGLGMGSVNRSYWQKNLMTCICRDRFYFSVNSST